MELLLSEEQRLLKDSAARLCGEFGGGKRLRDLRDGHIEIDAAAWSEAVRAGWPALLAPSAAGGLGLGCVELALVCEEIGRHLLRVPFAAAAVSAWALAQDGGGHAALAAVLDGSHLVVPAMATADVLPETRLEGGVVCLSGVARFIDFAATAHSYLVAAADPDGAIALYLAAREARGVSIRAGWNVDGSAAGELQLSHTPVSCDGVFATGDAAVDLVAAIRELQALAAAAELLGVAEASLAMTVEYMKTRQQFGRAIGSFQALQHRAVNGYVDIELLRSLVYRIAADRDRGPVHPAMVSAVKAKAARCALDVTRTALQLHGAIGYTDEHDIGLYHKRALVLAAQHGTELEHVSRFSRLTLPHE